MKQKRGWMIFITGMLIFSEISLCQAASDYPNRYIDLIIPYAPGGGSDVASRFYKDKVEQVIGQPLVYTYKPGAAGVVGSVYAKECKPDGYTLLVASISTMVLPPLTKRGAGTDYTMDDFTPVCIITYNPMIFCVRADSPYKTMQDFIKAAKTKKMKYSSHGVFTTAHIGMEALGRAAGFQATHIPYSGGAAAAMTAVLGGHVDMSVCGPTGMEAQLRILAVAQDKPWELHPEVPTMKDVGYAIKGEIYYSLWTPKGTPREIADKIYRAYKKALEDNREEITKRAVTANQIAMVTTPEELLRVYRASSDFYKKEIEKMGPASK
jgi:tripartite-type tricarboxylate transporter receptor subunit TctC